MEILDRYASPSAWVSRRSAEIDAEPDEVWDRLVNLDLSRSLLISLLFGIRGMGKAKRLTGLERAGLRVLDSRRPDHLILGVIGRFWKPSGDLVRFTPEQFVDFDQSEYCKAVWGFHLEPEGNYGTTVSTETRVICNDPSSERSFRRYWLVIGPFSGIIRIELLRLLKSSTHAQAPP